ncbi:dihydrofolate reductase [Brachyspira hyodysenteriae]|uniref:dihydrofolate reductase n=1 Tax=Brachyspira hyodysenteriae TaxID=159 RepID=UPI001ADD7F48|nr:dihydrofolate reductase [Brachyspira hyodysenteriae]MBT8719177.1 dihydrofolate reductase [Brachyspira hyodysenteriae]MBT8729419.1 dihydrofolate reductase [Brachyspira hyodysenteriae]MBT8732462.1 dihydrofolate reductase [Brachyspira hyodysenteriae]MBT8735045.1 dihydrofolate reductase [Brachyspira hyodysenteriae]MBT8737253.1 dihydrofolate reductase [Brachyspira hyodysenteriae]
MIVSLIAAVDSKNGIGLNGVMPWGHIKEDMQFFRSTTTGYTVIMGRVTFESLGSKPLPNRKNIVISSNVNTELLNKYDNLFYEKSFEDSISKLLLEKNKQIFIIGGESIYKKALDYADMIYLTHIDKDYHCDRFFPEIDTNLFQSDELKTFFYNDISVNIIKYTRI